MDDAPTKDVIDFPSVPPGVLYDVGHQCRLQYGAYSAFCEDMDVSVGTGGGGATLRSLQRLRSAHTPHPTRDPGGLGLWDPPRAGWLHTQL